MSDRMDAKKESIPQSPAPLPISLGRQLVSLAGPLIIANSFTTIQFTVDRAFLSQYNPDAMGASMPASMVFWLLMSLLHGTAAYSSTFVAQYTGAKMPHRVGPAVWHGIYFSIIAGSLFWLLWPLASPLFVAFNHDEKLIPLEATYFQTLLACGAPMGLVAALSGFFSGRGDSWTVTLINFVGTVVNIGLDYTMIFGKFGCPEMGIAGAGWATAIGSWASAIVAMLIFLKAKFRHDYATNTGWRIELDLVWRYIKYGFPSGMQWMLEALSFTFFVILVGQLGTAPANATSMTFTLNMFAFLPMMGLGQAVSILVGQRLGENRPELAERSTWLGVRWAFLYMIIIAVLYLTIPHFLMAGFRPPVGSSEAAEFAEVEKIVPTLLICVALYSLADAVYVVFSFALRGAGDTRFVMWFTFALAWPIMILPTWYLVTHGYSIYWPWAFATAYVFTMAICFWLRFRLGHWKSMRVIEAAIDNP
jgi:multidrug resistance protein, MATE family